MHTKVMPRTNISKVYYQHIVDDIEHDPLVRHNTVAAMCLIAAMCVLLGTLLWYTKMNPGNLMQTTGTVTNVSSGKIDRAGTMATFVTFSFKTQNGKQLNVRQPASEGLTYSEGQHIPIGYFPKNPNYARNLADNRPPAASLVLWVVPFVLLIWFTFLALFRHHARQVEIWNAAEAAEIDD